MESPTADRIATLLICRSRYPSATIATPHGVRKSLIVTMITSNQEFWPITRRKRPSETNAVEFLVERSQWSSTVQ